MERPVNGRLYRGTWLLVGLPLLVAAFSVARPTPLPRAFLPEFDGQTTKELATNLAQNNPNRFPGALGPAQWFKEQLAPYGLPIRTERFSAVIPGHGRVLTKDFVRAYVPKLETMNKRMADLVKKRVPKDQLEKQLKLDDIGWNHTVSTGTFMRSIGQYYDEVAAAAK